MQVQQGLVLALAHCLSISSNADLQQQIINEVLKDLAPACRDLQSLHQSRGAALTTPFTSLAPQSSQLHKFLGVPTLISKGKIDAGITLRSLQRVLTQHQALALHEQRPMEQHCGGPARRQCQPLASSGLCCTRLAPITAREGLWASTWHPWASLQVVPCSDPLTLAVQEPAIIVLTLYS